jgi:hypothetical protein
LKGDVDTRGLFNRLMPLTIVALAAAVFSEDRKPHGAFSKVAQLHSEAASQETSKFVKLWLDNWLNRLRQRYV